MPSVIKLSELVSQIQDTIEDTFGEETFWINAEITDVKKYPGKRWCFLKFIEKNSNTITTEIKGVFWSNTFNQIIKFEELTQRSFTDGIEITCNVRIRFHQRYGLDLEVLEIDYAYTLGKLELERQETLTRLVKENPQFISFTDGQYLTKNNKSVLPGIIRWIALITAPGSDGQRDFRQELENNVYGYKFIIREYLTQIQGDAASQYILQQLINIEKAKNQADVVVIVRGGGSQIDFRPFDDYKLSLFVAAFPIPILTGIGHDRNVSIVDLMARAYKTPTRVASAIIDINYIFEKELISLKERLFNSFEMILLEKRDELEEIKSKFCNITSVYIENKKNEFQHIKRLIKNFSPAAVLSKGYAIITSDDKIITNPAEIGIHKKLKTILKDEVIHSTVTQKTKYENEFDL